MNRWKFWAKYLGIIYHLIEFTIVIVSVNSSLILNFI